MRRAAVGRRGTLSMSIINKALLVLLLVVCTIAARADGISNGGGTATVSGTVTVNQGTSPWVDVLNPSSASSAGVAYAVTAALASNKVVKASAGNLYSFNVSADSTLSGAAWWIMIFDATSLPGDGGVTPAKCYAVPTGTTSYSAAFNLPVAFTTGIVIGVSTTGCFTKTASTHAFISGDAQ